jgi:hypothetical protein
VPFPITVFLLFSASLREAKALSLARSFYSLKTLRRRGVQLNPYCTDTLLCRFPSPCFCCSLRLCARQKPFLSPVRYLRVPRVPESPLLRIPASLRLCASMVLRALRCFEWVDGSFYGRSFASPSPCPSHQGRGNYGLAILRDPAHLEFSLCVVQRCLGKHGFRCSKFPLPVVGEGWGEGEQSVLSLCYVSQTGQACSQAAACVR